MTRRTTEYEIGKAVLMFLAQTPGGTATIKEIKAFLDASYPLTVSDREMSETRPNEERWHQQVRNLTSHRKTPGNAISDGLLAYSPRRLTITDMGRKYLTQRFARIFTSPVDAEELNRSLY